MKTKDWFLLAVRVVLGVVFLIAAYSKLSNIELAQMSVRAYELLPDDVANVFAIILSVTELTVGVFLLLGIKTRIAASVALTLLVIFVSGIISVWARGISIDCGCFSSGGAVTDGSERYPMEILRDLALIVGSALLITFPRSRLSIDRVLEDGQ